MVRVTNIVFYLNYFQKKLVHLFSMIEANEGLWSRQRLQASNLCILILNYNRIFQPLNCWVTFVVFLLSIY